MDRFIRSPILWLTLALVVHAACAIVPEPERGALGVVAIGEENATRVGAAVLAAGGNAVDAVVAVGYTLAVTHPHAGNLGGGGFMMVRLMDGTAVAVDFRETAPAAARRDLFLDARGEVVPGRSTVGWLAVGVPGSVAGLNLARERWGTRPLAELLAPAIRLARDGHRLDDAHARRMAEALPAMAPFPATAALYSNHGKPYPEGALWRQPELARLLERIARAGDAGFYRGATARQIAQAAAAGGGLLAEGDLAAYRPVVREPLRAAYRGHELLLMPPPSSCGVAIAQALAMLDLLDAPAGRDARAIHAYVEVLRRVYADRSEHLGDPAAMHVTPARLLARSYLRQRLADFSWQRATPSAAIAPGHPEAEETTHYAVVDRWGNAVAVTTTLNGAFGAKVAVPGLGLLLNNEMDDFAAKPGVPNLYGLVGGEVNAVAPGKRMLSSMSPSIVTRDGRVRLVVGTPGGSTIITTVLQILRGVVEEGLTLEAAVVRPRIHHQWLPDEVVYEPGAISAAVAAQLRTLGHTLRERHTIGEANCIAVRRDGAATAVVDPRGDGLALGATESPARTLLPLHRDLARAGGAELR
jgi:gamma-glutamyltranspeptidase/glutathione hydrolase